MQIIDQSDLPVMIIGEYGSLVINRYVGNHWDYANEIILEYHGDDISDLLEECLNKGLLINWDVRPNAILPNDVHLLRDQSSKSLCNEFLFRGTYDEMVLQQLRFGFENYSQ